MGGCATPANGYDSDKEVVMESRVSAHIRGNVVGYAPAPKNPQKKGRWTAAPLRIALTSR